jgi:hypothetical protein
MEMFPTCELYYINIITLSFLFYDFIFWIYSELASFLHRHFLEEGSTSILQLSLEEVSYCLCRLFRILRFHLKKKETTGYYDFAEYILHTDVCTKSKKLVGLLSLPAFLLYYYAQVSKMVRYYKYLFLLKEKLCLTLLLFYINRTATWHLRKSILMSLIIFIVRQSVILIIFFP